MKMSVEKVQNGWIVETHDGRYPKVFEQSKEAMDYVNLLMRKMMDMET